MSAPRFWVRGAKDKHGRIVNQTGLAKVIKRAAKNAPLTVVKKAAAVVKPKPWDQMIKLAQGEIGVHETPPGSNTGPRIREYQNATNLGGTGWPYCAAFDQWLCKQVGVDPGYHGASVPEWAAYAQKHGQWRTKPLPGRFPVMDFQHDHEDDHIGVVERVANGEPVTIEANTSPDNTGSQSNGGGVYRRTGRKPYIVGYIEVFGRR